jgi:geranylgeranyl diphosphate synthase type II
MDNAPLRRGKKTVHQKFDTNTAILSGDAALIFCYEELLKLPADKVSAAIKLFNKTALEVCEGQQFDMLFENKSTVSVDDYLEMIRLKTAVLLGCALQLGAMLADANSIQQELMYEFGMQMGVAFQLQDDILDTFGNTETFGKQVGGDIIQNKKTFLLLKAFELANLEQQKVLADWLTKKEFDNVEKVEAVKNIFNQIGVRKIAETEMEIHFQKAIHAVHQQFINDEKKNRLIAFASALMKREK